MPSNLRPRFSSGGGAAEIPPWLRRIERCGRHHATYVASVSVLAALLVLFFFCPRFVMFKGLSFPLAQSDPEVNRAVFALQQLDNPFVEIENPSNLPMNWRLLFPLLGHYLGLPPPVFLALPYVGCLCALALMAHVSVRELKDRGSAALLTVALATSAWFFVSTGWLAYFDSWYILALMATTCLRSRWALVVAALLTPWIDERFLIALPLCLAVRSYVHSYPSQALVKDVAYDVLVAAVAAGPYLTYRLVAYWGATDNTTAIYLDQTFGQMCSLSRYLYGAWAGMRMLWLLVAAFFWLSYLRAPLRWSLIVSLGSLATLGVALAIAGDIHRSASMFIPAAWGGAVLLDREKPGWCRNVLLMVVTANLLLPAAHVITKFEVPIRYAYAEWDRYLDPPSDLTAEYYNERGAKLIESKQPDQALEELDMALRLDPQYAPAHMNRGLVFLSQGDLQKAAQSLAEAIRLAPSDPSSAEAYYHRAICAEAMGQPVQAEMDYDLALRVAPPDWPRRADCSARLARVSRRAGSP